MNNIISWQPQDLKNDLVALNPLNEVDFESLYDIASDPLIWEQHPAVDRYNKEVFQSFFKLAMESESAFLLRKTDTQEIIGSTRFCDYDSENRSIVIGYTFLARKYWGTAINKSLKTLMINYAFAQGMQTVTFYAGAANFRSQKAIEKLGAIKVKEFIKEDNGVEMHKVAFAISREKWDKQQEK